MFYLMLVLGIIISLYYCGGKFKSIFFFGFGGNEDGCCGNKMKSKGCCDEKVIFIKVKDNYYLSNSVNIVYNYFKILDVVLLISIFEFFKEDIFVYYMLNYYVFFVLYDNFLYLKY